MALPDFNELRRRTYARLRDSEKSFVEPVSVDQWLNEGYRDLNARLRILRDTDAATASASGVVTLPADLVEILNLWFGEFKAEFVDNDTFLWYANQSNSTGEKVLARVVGSTVETYPEQQNEAYTLEYVARPTEMVEGNDTPAALTEELADRLAYYAIAEAKWQEGEMGEGDMFMGRFVEGLPGKPRSMYRFKPQPLSLSPAPGPFD